MVYGRVYYTPDSAQRGDLAIHAVHLFFFVEAFEPMDGLALTSGELRS